MRKTLTAVLAAITLVGGLAPAADASAQYRRHRNNDDAAAAAIAGFALGAAVGGDGRVYARRPGYAYGYGYDRGYGYYDRPYYGRHHRHAYGRRDCWTERYWDPYYGRVERRFRR